MNLIILLDFILNHLISLIAIIISLYSFHYVKKVYKSTNVTITKEFIKHRGISERKLKISPFSSDQIINLSRPKLRKKYFLFYIIKIDHSFTYTHEIDQETHITKNNPIYLDLDKFSDLPNGNYKLIVRIDRPPYKLKFKFKLPFQSS